MKPLTSSSAAALLLATQALMLSADTVDDYAPGRSGEALKNTLARHCRPTTLTDESAVHDCLLDALGRSGKVYDMISGLRLRGDAVSSAVTGTVPSDWERVSPEYQAAIARDLHNLLLTDPVIALDRQSLPFAITGLGAGIPGAATGISFNDIDCIEPVDSLKGDIARKIFYAATLYPCELWSGWGRNVFENTPYPTLRSSWGDLYMKWHRNDPVSESEKRLDATFSTLQGNSNPFVTHPALAEYLWGDNAGEIYLPGSLPDNPGETPPTEPTPQEQRLPLRAVYRHSDRYIYLYSPYIPENATWTVDGNAVTTDTVDIAPLSDGTHELRYRTTSSSGKLLILIKP